MVSLDILTKCVFITNVIAVPHGVIVISVSCA